MQDRDKRAPAAGKMPAAVLALTVLGGIVLFTLLSNMPQSTAEYPKQGIYSCEELNAALVFEEKSQRLVTADMEPVDMLIGYNRSFNVYEGDEDIFFCLL